MEWMQGKGIGGGVVTVGLLLMVGCASEPQAPGSEAVAEARAPIDASAAAAGKRFAVTVEDEGGLRTRIFDGLGSQLVGYETLVVPAKSGMWRWEESVREVTQTDCGCMMDKLNETPGTTDTSGCEVSKEVIAGRLINDATGQAWEPEESTMAPADADWEVTFTPVGAVGSTALVKICQMIYYCGAAHPNTECRQAVVALDGESPQELAPRELSPVVGAEHFEGQSFGLDEGVEVDPKRAALVALTPTWDPEARELRAEQQYAFEACYACSDGEWSAYSVSTFVSDRPFNEKAGVPALPRGLQDLLTTSSWQVRGLSAVPESAGLKH
ncbi:hypothetical protein DL240_09070 [Lujinxingia litoralis]|uniref:Uncharacterized protein n=1 Tax=Lujinxingia litoralis TaxID=2211119 RepID=A0A328CBX8_9DELT|nr:hypothetical protein [Lujinxingia litoralis]RAL23027.1 hypothetical protein DL240_09070 [Lujinxingia litoralis]